MNKKNLSLVMTVVLLLANPCNVVAMDISSLTEEQQSNARTIAKIVAENWETYGVLPSIAVAQALQETSLGKAYNNGNLWGIKSGRISYPSVADGTYGYMRVINNGYYDDALHQTDYKKQIRAILDGGYCEPEGNYYNDILWLVDRYQLDNLDKEMFKAIEEKKEAKRRKRIQKRKEKARKQKWNHLYTMVYDENVPPHSVIVNKKIIKGGTVRIFDRNHLKMQGIYDAEPGANHFMIKTSDKKMDGEIVSIEVVENSKG